MARVFLLVACFLLSFTSSLVAQNPIVNKYIFSDSSAGIYLGKFLSIFHDSSGTLTFSEVKNMPFPKSNEEVPNLGIGKCYWVKFCIENQTKSENLFLVLEYPLMDEIDFFYHSERGWIAEKTGDNFSFNNRKYKNQNYIFKLNISKGNTRSYYLRIRSDEQIILPIYINNPDNVYEAFMKEDVLAGLLFGTLIIMVVYNLFLFFMIKDMNYLLYVIYVTFIILAQATIMGYSFRFLFFNYPFFADAGAIIFPALAGIFVLLFFDSFLKLKSKIKYHRFISKCIILLLFFAIILAGLRFDFLATRLMDWGASLGSCYLIFCCIFLSYRGYRQAKFLTIGWLIALVGFTIYSLRNMGILPYNFFTNSTMQVGVGIESIIFSFALADRINILKKENDQQQKEIIWHLRENEKYLLAVKDSELMVERLKKESIVSQFESLKSQVNPHFLFNSLNVLLELIYQNQDKAVKFVKELSDVYRYVLDSKRRELVDLASELEFIESFSYLLKIRYPDNLYITISLCSLHSACLPPLAIQLLLENAIKHNVISETHPLTINIVEENNYVVVSNNLQKKKGVQKSSGIGLQNLNARYEYLSNQEVIVVNDDNYFIVKIPLLQRVTETE